MMGIDILGPLQQEVNGLRERNNILEGNSTRSLQIVNDLLLKFSRYKEMIARYQVIESKVIALLHLPFSATEAFEKARKELLEVITKTDPPCHYEERSDEVISKTNKEKL